MRRRAPIVAKYEVLMALFLGIYWLICVLFMEEIPGLMNWLGIFVFIFAVATWKRKTGMGWFNPYTIFQMFMLAFNYGQPLMWALGIHSEGEIGSGQLFRTKTYFPTQGDVLQAQMYTCLATLIFHIGVMYLTKRQSLGPVRESAVRMKKLEEANVKKAMRTIFGVMLLVTGPVAIAYRWYEMQVARSYGYIALYYGSHNTQQGYIQVLLYFFFPAIAGYLISSDYSKKSRCIAYGVFGIYAMLGLLAGDRDSWFYSLVVLLWLHTFYKKTPMRTYVACGVAGIIGLYIVNVFIAVRDTGLASITSKDFLSAFQTENSPIVDGFFEMGGTMSIITYFLHMGNGIYPYANTYLTSLLGMVSSRTLSFLGIKQVLIANWFSQDYLGISWGTGFSMIAEAFVNGGYLGGLIYMLILGGLLGKLLNYTRTTTQSNPLRLFIMTAGLNIILGFIRGALYLTLKELLYGVFISVLLVKIVASLSSKRIREEE